MSIFVKLLLRFCGAVSSSLGFSIVAFSIAYFVWYRYKNRRILKLMNKIPGLPNVPIIGNTLESVVEHDELFTRITSGHLLWNKHHGVWKAWSGNMPYIFISKAQAAEAVLCSSKEIAKSHEYNFIHPWLGTGLLTSAGSKWYKRRKIITPAFHFKILDDFVDVFREQSEIFVQKLSEVADGNAFNIYPFVTHCTLDIICETAMGMQINAQNCSDSDYVKAVYEIGSIIQSRQAKVWLQPDCLFRFSSLYKKHQECIKILHGFSNKIIEERRKQFLNKSVAVETENSGSDDKKRLAFLDLLIQTSEEGRNLSQEDMREEVDTFMFEGHDTTSTAISWTLYLIGTDRKIQERLHEEVDEIFGGCDRGFTMKDLNNMKYLERCIKEGLRLFPSVPIFGRTLSQDLQIGDYLVPKGATTYIVAYQIHRDPEIFSDPEKFDPDRFLPEQSRGRHPYSYIPFSAGPRNCIGQKFAMLEEKAVISSVLRHYRVEAVTKREDITLLGELILRPKHGLYIKLIPR